MEFEILTDKNGKEHMVLNTMDFDEDIYMGDKLEDFEILQPLGSGCFANVIKVCSLINILIKNIRFRK